MWGLGGFIYVSDNIYLPIYLSICPYVHIYICVCVVCMYVYIYMCIYPVKVWSDRTVKMHSVSVFIFTALVVVSIVATAMPTRRC